MEDVDRLMSLMGKNDKTDYKIEQILNNEFVLWDEKKPPRFGNHLSSLKVGFRGKNRLCYRETTFAYYYEPAPAFVPPVTLLRKYLEGWYVHLKWQKIFKDSAKIEVVEMEYTRIDPIWNIWHTPDAVLVIPSISPDKRICEIKSMAKASFEDAIKAGNPYKAHPDGYKQSQLYMYLLGLNHAFLLLECKDDQRFITMSFKFDPHFVAPYVDRFNKMSQYREVYNNNRVADRVCNSMSDERAMSCSMRHVCFLPRAEREKYLRTDNPLIQVNSSLIHEN